MDVSISHVAVEFFPLHVVVKQHHAANVVAADVAHDLAVWPGFHAPEADEQHLADLFVERFLGKNWAGTAEQQHKEEGTREHRA